MATRTKASAGITPFFKGDVVRIDGSAGEYEVLSYSGPNPTWIHLGEPLPDGKGWRPFEVEASSVHLIRRRGDDVLPNPEEVSRT